MFKRDGEKFETIIDVDDLEKVRDTDLSFHLQWDDMTKSYYAKATIYNTVDGKRKAKTVYLHHLIMPIESNKQRVDHKNHNTLDNRKDNLEIIDDARNLKQRRGANLNNKSSGIRNVCWSTNDEKWIVQLQINGKNTVLGKFEKEDLDKAAELAKRKREEIYGKYCGFS